MRYSRTSGLQYRRLWVSRRKSVGTVKDSPRDTVNPGRVRNLCLDSFRSQPLRHIVVCVLAAHDEPLARNLVLEMFSCRETKKDHTVKSLSMT
jgi:hypothetical protein